jgi:C4-dicarboxylate transporter, DctM subunit
MSPEIIGTVGIIVLLAMMFLGIPIGLCMALVGFLGYTAIAGFNPALMMLGTIPYSNIASYMFSVLPVFLLMGEWAELSGMTNEAYRSANTWLGRLPGGLAMASIGGAALFSAVSGSSMACAATMTKVSIDDLTKYKYSPELATGALAAGGTLGQLIPPGVAYVFYAIMTNTSVGEIMVACLIPGLLLTLMYFTQIYIQCRINPALGPRGASTTFKQKIVALKDVWAVIVLFGLIMGGIWFGVFTPTEAGSVGAIGALIFALSRKRLTRKNFTQSLKSTIQTCGMIFAIIMGAMVFTYFASISKLPELLAEWVVTLNMSAVAVVIIMMIVYFILGTAMDTISMVILTLPVFLPVLVALDVDLVWYGVLVIIQMELSQITPPVGMNMFIVAGMVKDRGITMDHVFRGVIPFCITMVVFIALIIAFPQIAMFLPDTMMSR